MHPNQGMQLAVLILLMEGWKEILKIVIIRIKIIAPKITGKRVGNLFVADLLKKRLQHNISL